MSWLQSLDLSLLHLVRETLRTPFLDWLMPRLSANVLFAPALLLGAAMLAWKGGIRGRVCILMIAGVVLIGDNLICGPLKTAIGRARPPALEASTQYNVGIEQGSNHSMPSSHAANWFAATAIAFLYYRRTLWFMVPVGLGVAYSRVYKGAHYPTDVLAGMVLGACYAVVIAWLLNSIWRAVGKRWFPIWWERLPSLISISRPLERCLPTYQSLSSSAGEGGESASFAGIVSSRSESGVLLKPVPIGEGRSQPSIIRSPDDHWLRLGYLFVVLLLLARLAYLAIGHTELSSDEAYQWVWSKNLALSYYSKPLLIACAQRAGTTLWGDNEFGVRFLSPISAALVSLLLLRFLARQRYVRSGFWLVLISAATPLLEVGATVLTVDCLLVLFWTLAMISGWQAVQDRSVRAWCWTGLWMGLGCLSKYTALFQPVCLGIFFALCKPARLHLRRPGPYLAVGITLLCTLPIVIWNLQHDWITLSHVATNARVDRPWTPSLSYLQAFVVAELGLLNPFFLIAAVWAAVASSREFIRLSRGAASGGQPMLLQNETSDALTEPARLRSLSEKPVLACYLFCMGVPLFLGYTLYTLHSKVQPNWIAASVIPLFTLMAIYWESRYRAGLGAVKACLAAGLVVGLTATIVLHDPNLITKLTGHSLPPAKNPMHRVRGWAEVAKVVNEARQKLISEGRPVFIICGHYGVTGELSFYLPEAKAGVPDHPLVYFQTSDVPMNQFYFWPGYGERKGENAIYVIDTETPAQPPPSLRKEFAEIKDLGMRDIFYRGQLCRKMQLFECRDLQ